MEGDRQVPLTSLFTSTSTLGEYIALVWLKNRDQVAAEGRPQNVTALLSVKFWEDKSQEGRRRDGCDTWVLSAPACRELLSAAFPPSAERLVPSRAPAQGKGQNKSHSLSLQ